MAGETLRYSSGSPIPVKADNPLTVLIHRLEAATSRLEDIASSSGSIEQQANGSISAASGEGMPTSSSMPDLPKGGSREASTATVQHVSQPKEPLPASIEEMDKLIESEVKGFVDASKGLDSLVEEQVRWGRYIRDGARHG